MLVTSFIKNNETLLNVKTDSITVNDIEIYNKFINHLTDYELVMNILKKNESIKRRISQLSEKDKEFALYEYSQKIMVSEIGGNEHVVNLVWDNIDEGKEILKQIINLTKKNLAKTVFIKLKNSLDLIKNIHERTNSLRIEYLLEQRDLARELNISENQINSINLYQSLTASNISNTQENIAYYLRGYKAIEKEISLIRNRDFQSIKDVKKTISSLELNNQIKWVNFNIYSMSAKSKNNFIGQQIISIILGLLLGLGLIQIFRAYSFFNYKK